MVAEPGRRAVAYVRESTEEQGRGLLAGRPAPGNRDRYADEHDLAADR